MKPKSPKGILLDLDDTIIAFDELTEKCWRMTAKEFAAQSRNLGIVDLERVITSKAKWFWSDKERHREWRGDLVSSRRKIVSLALKDCGVDDVEFANRIADRYSEMKEEMLYVFPGAKETIMKLREAGYKLALVTNGSSSSQRHKIEKFGLTELFDNVLIEGEQKVGKPETEIYVRAIEALGISPGEAWMVGDNLEWDVIAPQSIGIMGVWINPLNRPNYLHEKPYLTISRLPEIEHFLL